jgi:hypothetical protein
MKAYKGTINQKCINVKYEVGKTYTYHGDPVMCKVGFHYCEKPDYIFDYYDYNKDFVLLEIDVLGDTVTVVEGEKAVTNKFKVIRVIPKTEYNQVFKNYSFDGDTMRNDKGKIINKKITSNFWTNQLTEYDDNKNVIHTKGFIDPDNENKNPYEKWYEYDDNNNMIHAKDSQDYELWVEYDKHKNRLFEKDTAGYKYYFEYDKYNNKISHKVYFKKELLREETYQYSVY